MILSPPEASLICDALNGTWLREETVSARVVLSTEIADACRLDGLGEKWDVDAGDLARRLAALDEAEARGVLERVTRFWGVDCGLPPGDALRVAGFRLAPARDLLVNSAVLAAGAYGTYVYAAATREELAAFMRSPYESRVGYAQTADLIERWTGTRPALSRETSVLGVGEQAMVVRLRYRIDPRAKGASVPDDDAAWELAAIRRTA